MDFKFSISLRNIKRLWRRARAAWARRRTSEATHTLEAELLEVEEADRRAASVLEPPQASVVGRAREEMLALRKGATEDEVRWSPSSSSREGAEPVQTGCSMLHLPQASQRRRERGALLRERLLQRRGRKDMEED